MRDYAMGREWIIVDKDKEFTYHLTHWMGLEELVEPIKQLGDVVEGVNYIILNTEDYCRSTGLTVPDDRGGDYAVFTEGKKVKINERVMELKKEIRELERGL